MVTIRYRLNKGDKRDVTVTLAPYDKIFYASFVDGVGGFALTKAQAEGMLAKMDALLAGEDVTTETPRPPQGAPRRPAVTRGASAPRPGSSGCA